MTEPAPQTTTAGRTSLLILGATSALGSLAIQMFIPAMPMMARELGASASMLQLTITLYLGGLTIGQLVSGPLADHFGRRPMLLSGIGLFLAGSIMAMLAPGPAILLLGRLLQSLGGATSLVAGRSIVADKTHASGDGENASRHMAGLSLITLVSPMLAPGIGGTVADAAGWRAVFMVLAAAALLLGILALRTVEETVRDTPSSNRPSWRTYRALLGNPRFVRLIVGNASYSMALYVFLAITPFLMAERLHLTARFSGVSLLFIAGTMIGGTLLHRHAETARRAMTLSKMITAAGAAIMIACTLAFPLSLTSLILPMCILALGIGMNGPAALAHALGVDRSRIGTASSLFGATQTLLSALAIALVALLRANTQLDLALLVGVCVACAVILLPGRHRLLPTANASQASA